MKARIIWVVVSCLLALSLVLAACAPAPPKEVAPPEVAPPKEVAPAVVPEVVAPVAEMPKYGGTITLGLGGTEQDSQIGYANDQAYAGTYWWSVPCTITNEELIMGDWTLGPAGSGVADFSETTFAPEGFMRDTGALAESWQIPDDETLIFKIRRGVRWHNKPPVNGREFTAEDVVFNIKRTLMNPTFTTYNMRRMPTKVTDVYIDPNDKWTVVVKVSEASSASWLEEVADLLWFYAPEVIAKYGNSKDWRNLVGTGAFIFTDFVPASSGTFVKNPDYWLKDPVGPGKGNQLPYLDRVIALEIPDESTMMAAVRTAKVDYVNGVTWEDALSMKRINPAIGQRLGTGTTYGGIMPRPSSTDPRAEPFKKKRVRQAMAMAIDNEAIVRDFYGGTANLLQVFFYPNSPYYTPVEQMPEIVQKMYGYYPAEAKKILAEEGYPNGFKTTITIPADEADLFAIVKDNWAKINVDLEIELKTPAIYRSILAGRSWPALASVNGGTTGYAEKWLRYGPADPNLPRFPANWAEVNDPLVNDAMNRANAVYGDLPARSKIMQDIMPYILEQAWYFQLPAPASALLYQPWLKNNYGQLSVGQNNSYNWTIFAWLDQELKKSMGYK